MFLGWEIPMLFDHILRYAHVALEPVIPGGHSSVFHMRLCRPEVIPIRWGCLLRLSLACSLKR